VTAAPISAIVVDDDASARERLRSLLGSCPGVHVVEECAGGRAAVNALRDRGAALVFLDVEMPDLDGFGVIAEVGAERMPPVIFTSAYSQYAVRAFEAYALDYLLKPFDATRLAAAIDRARQTTSPGQEGVVADPRVSGLLQQIGRGSLEKHPDAIAIKTGDQYVVVPVSDIDWIAADGNYARIYVGKRARLLTRTLTSLEKELLDPELFVRVHRSAIVNTSRIASIETTHHGDLTLVLHDGTTVPCSRRHRELLERRIFFST
jgi:two-component system LytT family response regulator